MMTNMFLKAVYSIHIYMYLIWLIFIKTEVKESGAINKYSF